MPDRRLTNKEREDIAATSMLAADDISVDPKVWTATHAKIIKRAAEYPEVERVLVHPAIKKALCQTTDTDRAWLSKVRPYFGHYYHFHVRIACPEGSVGCSPQKPVAHEEGYGCGKELADWIKLVTPKPHPATPVPPPTHPVKPAPGKPPMSLEQLPAECRMVLTTGNPGIPKSLLDAQRKADQQIAAAHAAAAQKHAAAVAQKHVAAAQKKGAPAKPETTPTPAVAAKPETTPAPQAKAAQH
jgi:penicillin-insensitive murein endopeptidase